eukprot:jgi/Tetstr1/461991/TSEL_007064.t2
MARNSFAALAALLFLATAHAASFTKCGCGVVFHCSSDMLDTWRDAASDLKYVTCDQCKDNDGLKKDEKSACLTFTYDEDITSEAEVTADLSDLLNEAAWDFTSSCYTSDSTTCDVWEKELEAVVAVDEDFENAVKAAAGLATGVLIAIIVIPILLIALIVGLSIWCCCFRNNTNVVVVQGGDSGAQPMAK